MYFVEIYEMDDTALDINIHVSNIILLMHTVSEDINSSKIETVEEKKVMGWEDRKEKRSETFKCGILIIKQNSPHFSLLGKKASSSPASPLAPSPSLLLERGS